LRAQSFVAALRDADEVLAPSPFVAEAFAGRRGEPRIHVVPNAVAEFGPVLRPPSPSGAPLRLASIGVTIEHKGFQTVVAALRLARLPEVSYTIFGVALPPLFRELQKAGDEIPGLELRLFNGFQPRHLPVLLADADAVIVPSQVAETYSIVAREALACGVPVIVAAIGALPEAVREGETGWLFEPSDAADLAALLLRLHGDRSLLTRAQAAAGEASVVTVAERTDAVQTILAAAVERGSRDPGEEGRELPLMRQALLESDIRNGLR
jgi:glycogen(starch) synthase